MSNPLGRFRLQVLNQGEPNIAASCNRVTNGNLFLLQNTEEGKHEHADDRIDAFGPQLDKGQPNVVNHHNDQANESHVNQEKLIDASGRPDLLRLFVKRGVYAYARPKDIILIESCDHLVKIHLAFNYKTKTAIRNDTLKDFLFQLPQNLFLRVNRFCAINAERLSGGNYEEQILEFDFGIVVRPKHAISQAVFNTIGK